MSEVISIKLIKSPIGKPRKFRAVLQGMGLTKLNKTVELENTNAVLGMVRKVAHMVKIEDNKN